MKRKFIVSGLILLLSAAILALSYLLNLQNNPRLSWEDNQSEAYDKIPAGADNPDWAALQNYYMCIDPVLKRIPEDGLDKAYQKTKDELRRNKNGNSLSNLDWIEIPSNMGGRTRAIMIDPNDTAGEKVWAGSVTGGLWFNNKIYDSTSAWQAVNDFWPGLSISCIVSDPLDPMTFYVGTGEYQTARLIYRESSGVGMGIWKSTDGGESWALLLSTEEFKYISDIKLRIEDGQSVVYAGVVSGFYEGTNFPVIPNDGLYRSSDGGETWQQVLPNIPGEESPYAPADLEIAPTGRIFVGTMKNPDGKGGATILYSDSGLMGTWTVFDDYEDIIQNNPDYPVPGRVIIACSPSDENRVYALVGAGWLNSTNFNYARGKYILRSDNGGQNWTEMNLPGGDPDWATLSWHAFAAAVDPNNPDVLFVGGKDVWRSINGGLSWVKLSDWTLMYSGGGEDYVHCDQHQQLFAQNSSNKMFYTNDGGVFYTDSASSDNPIFQEKNNNYSTLQFYTCAIYPEPDMDYFVGGLQDNGTLLSLGDDFKVGDMIDTGDGAYCFFDQTEPQLMITSTYFNRYSLFIDWDFDVEMGLDGSGVFINPADYDSQNNILYANAIKFNGTNSNQILRIRDIPGNPVSELVSLPTGLNTWFSAVKVSSYSPEGSTTLFLGSQNGRLFKVHHANNNPLVSEMDTDILPTAYVSCIAIGGSEDTLLVTFSNFGVPSVWQSYDGGANWLDISGNLPDMPVRWAIYHPQNSLKLMLATEIGIWSTQNANAVDVVWEPDPGIPNVRVDMLKIRKADLCVLAASHGRGFFHTTWENNVPTHIENNNEMQLQVYPNPSTDKIFIDANTQINSVSVFNNLGSKVSEQEINKASCQINTSLFSGGVYLFRIKAGKENIVKKVFIK